MACALSQSWSAQTSHFLPGPALFTLMVPAAVLLIASSSSFCAFLPVPCGLSTININNLGNCLLLLKSIPVLLQLSAGLGLGPRNAVTGPKQNKRNEMKAEEKRISIIHHPTNLGGDAQSLRNMSTKFQLKSLPFQSSPMGGLWPCCWKKPALQQEPHKAHAKSQGKAT